MVFAIISAAAQAFQVTGLVLQVAQISGQVAQIIGVVAQIGGPACTLIGGVGKAVTRDSKRGKSASSSSTNRCLAGGDEIEKQLDNMIKDAIYWMADEGIYIHASGMCYDPVLKAYFKRIDPIKGDLRSIYYVIQNGKFSLTQKGKLGKSNKIILEDGSWDRAAIYSVKSPNYMPDLPKLFKKRSRDLTWDKAPSFR